MKLKTLVNLTDELVQLNPQAFADMCALVVGTRSIETFSYQDDLRHVQAFFTLLRERVGQSSAEITEAVDAWHSYIGRHLKDHASADAPKRGDLKCVVAVLADIEGRDTGTMSDLAGLVAGQRECHEFQYADDLRHVRDLLSTIHGRHGEDDPELAKDADGWRERIDRYLED